MGEILFHKTEVDCKGGANGKKSKQLLVQLAELHIEQSSRAMYLGPDRSYHMIALLGSRDGEPVDFWFGKPLTNGLAEKLGNIVHESRHILTKEQAILDTASMWEYLYGIYERISLEGDEA